VSQYILQIVHETPGDGIKGSPNEVPGTNVIETAFDKMYSAEAEGRRHGKQPHRAGVGCQMFMFEGDFTIELEHGGHEESVEGCKLCAGVDEQEYADRMTEV
jgi:hypothetical protein